ncbi:MAG TPA: RidA family protein [Bryobacteraceae bacterium]|jgi:enamine deaminase RidA (YjgF/YER057c/UK114 family)|nr:RidA family protein [Bryobacteraceae bacterium]
MGRRVSIEVPGFEHDNPIPAACRIGSFLITSAISGKEAFTGKLPEGIDAQCGQMFDWVRKILDIAGGSPEDVVKMNVWLRDRSQRPSVNRFWLEMFPDPHSRPARHTFAAPDLAGAMLVQCEVIAVIDEKRA